MKKKIFRIATGLFLFAAMIIPSSCEFLGDDCAWCTRITDNNGEISEGVPLYLCDEQLYEKQDSEPVTIFGVTSYWSCE